MPVSKRTKILITVNSLLTCGGVECRTADFVSFLGAKGYEAEVWVLRRNAYTKGLFPTLDPRVREMPVYDYRDGRNVVMPLGLVHFCLAVRVGRFGIVYCVQPPSHYFARCAAVPNLGRRFVVMERLSYTDRSPKLVRLDRLLAPFTHRIVCVSRMLRDDVIERAQLPEAKVVAIENGMALCESDDPLPEVRRILAGKFVFGCVGSLSVRKRQRLVLDAMRRLLDQGHQQFMGLFVGGVDDDPGVEEYAQQLGLGSHVLFTGEQSNPHNYYPLFRAFVFASVKEGLGNVWVEAMHHGLPVVCANVRPMSDYVRHDVNGLLFEADNAGSLAEQMDRLMQDANVRERLGRAACATARETFDRDTQFGKLLALAAE